MAFAWISEAPVERDSKHLEARERAIVLDCWEGIVEVVEKIAPLGIAAGLTKSYGVVFQGPPRNEKQITIGRLKAPAHLDTEKARRGFNQGTGLLHRLLEGCFLPWNYV
jgi:hypothetical protein